MSSVPAPTALPAFTELAARSQAPMKLLFINQFYWPDMAATSQMMVDLCEQLATHGHEVHVLCSRGQYDAGTRAGQRAARHEVHNGVHIHRVTATGFGKKSMLGRVLDYASFHLLIGLRTLLTGGRYDAVITLTTPPLIGVYATILRRLTRTKHLCWVMDLHPDCEFELGVFQRNALLPRLFDKLNAMHFRHANRCVVLGDHMARRLTDKGVSPDRLSVIPVWGHDFTDPDQQWSTPQASPLRRELDLEGKFVVMYSGNAGLVHTFDAVCAAALRLADDPRFVFLFVGGGRRLDEVRAFQAKHNLENIRVRGYFPREQLDQSLTMANVHLITLRDGMAGIAVPCKLYGIMAAGRPSIFIGPDSCETADAIREFECGAALKTDDADGLIRTLLDLVADPAYCASLGRNARMAFDNRYNPNHCAALWREMLETV